MESSFSPFGRDVSLGPRVNALNWTLCGIALLIVCARIYTRIRIVRKTGWDDWVMVLAMVGRFLSPWIKGRGPEL